MEIFDPLRKKNVRLSPEEKVRQEVIAALNSRMGVPMTLMMSECPFKYNGLLYRADILVYDRKAGKLMLVECKAEDVKLDGAVLDQVVRYNLALRLPYLMITNAKTTYICKLDPAVGEYSFLDAVPSYEEMLAEAEKIAHNG